ncbi:MAG TPA: DUF3810 domain-containing protein [Chitinophagaceae bacterium]|nr:DUF3810 domain-containing protein [Chitinophagaceae bacterium]
MQQFLTRLFARLMKSWSWVVLIVLTILIKWASWYPEWVERNYSLGVYPVIARVQRFLFGWVPFSIGDLFYGFLVLVIIFRTYKFFKFLWQKRLTRQFFVIAMQQFIFFVLFVYVFFNLLWGLNYNRLGIARQLNLEVKSYTVQDLDTLTSLLLQKASYYAAFVSEAQRDSFNRKKDLFHHADKAYNIAEKEFSFLKYRGISVKPSLFSYLGNYLGFQGYYNPFSGEGQVNTTIPRFLEPFVTSHEIAHQLGYAKENEANFVGFLACRSYDNNAFRYSVYYDMYNYAIAEVYRRDTALAKSIQQMAHPQLKKDQEEFRKFYRKYNNPVEDLVMWGYGHFLKANNQPAGKRSYNEVVTWLIAYYKKYGKDAL